MQFSVGTITHMWTTDEKVLCELQLLVVNDIVAAGNARPHTCCIFHEAYDARCPTFYMQNYQMVYANKIIKGARERNRHGCDCAWADPFYVLFGYPKKRPPCAISSSCGAPEIIDSKFTCHTNWKIIIAWRTRLVYQFTYSNLDHTTEVPKGLDNLKHCQSVLW